MKTENKLTLACIWCAFSVLYFTADFDKYTPGRLAMALGIGMINLFFAGLFASKQFKNQDREDYK
jgi:hypothetical protein